MATSTGSHPLVSRHTLDYSRVTMIGLYVVLGIFALFSFLNFIAAVSRAFNLPSDWDRVYWILYPIAATTVPVAAVGAIVGLARGQEWGRLLAVYSAGVLFTTVFFIPASLGLVWVLYHPHLPNRARDAIGHVTTAAMTPHSESPAAHPVPPDGLSTRARRVIVGLLALSELLTVAFFVLVLTQNESSLSWKIVIGFFGLSLVAIVATAIIGIGRGLPWGTAAAVFACGIFVLTGYIWVPGAVILFLLFFRRRIPAAAPA